MRAAIISLMFLSYTTFSMEEEQQPLQSGQPEQKEIKQERFVPPASDQEVKYEDFTCGMVMFIATLLCSGD